MVQTAFKLCLGGNTDLGVAPGAHQIQHVLVQFFHVLLVLAVVHAPHHIIGVHQEDAGGVDEFIPGDFVRIGIGGQMKPIADGIVDVRFLAREEKPLVFLGLVILRVGLKGLRRVPLRVHGEGNHFEIPVAPPFLLEAAHLGADHGAGPGAVGEDEIHRPDLALKLRAGKHPAAAVLEGKGGGGKDRLGKQAGGPGSEDPVAQN